MKKVVIFGAGLAGLIAARMLADRRPSVLEAQSGLPNNHHALLRFRSTIVGDVTNLPFKKVEVLKHVLSEEGSNPIRDAAIYSIKVTGKMHARSILDVRPVERYIAPPDMIQRLASTALIAYDCKFEDWCHELVRPGHEDVISTIPVNRMMEVFKWEERPAFDFQRGWTLKAKIADSLDCQLNATVYSARAFDSWYRASITGNTLMIEGTGPLPGEDEQKVAFDVASECFGLDENDFEEPFKAHESKYQKISELSSDDREKVKRFIMWLSKEHRIYSLGRFATWRPKLLLDDLVNDVRVIAKLMGGQSEYNNIIGKE